MDTYIALEDGSFSRLISQINTHEGYTPDLIVKDGMMFSVMLRKNEIDHVIEDAHLRNLLNKCIENLNAKMFDNTMDLRKLENKVRQLEGQLSAPSYTIKDGEETESGKKIRDMIQQQRLGDCPIVVAGDFDAVILKGDEIHLVLGEYNYIPPNILYGKTYDLDRLGHKQRCTLEDVVLNAQFKQTTLVFKIIQTPVNPSMMRTNGVDYPTAGGYVGRADSGTAL